LTRGIVFDIKRFSIHDGPGIRTTVFFKGCPLRCWWCHNPESQVHEPEMMFHGNRCVGCGACVDVCPQGAISLQGDVAATDAEKCVLCGTCAEVCYADAREIVGREMTAEDVAAEIERDVPFYDESGGGATISGGEPLLQVGFLRAVLRACKEREIHTALDTCGFAPWEALESVRGLVDLFLYDLKLMDDARHRAFTGASNEPILGNLRALAERGHAIALRVPLVPGINDDEENIRRIAVFAAALPRLQRVDVLPYHRAGTDKYSRMHRAYRLPEARPPSQEKIAQITEILHEFDLQARVGG
jgi:pyruvate formate lyase activating enzyme